MTWKRWHRMRSRSASNSRFRWMNCGSPVRSEASAFLKACFCFQEFSFLTAWSARHLTMLLQQTYLATSTTEWMHFYCWPVVKYSCWKVARKWRHGSLRLGSQRPFFSKKSFHSWSGVSWLWEQPDSAICWQGSSLPKHLHNTILVLYSMAVEQRNESSLRKYLAYIIWRNLRPRSWSKTLRLREWCLEHPVGSYHPGFGHLLALHHALSSDLYYVYIYIILPTTKGSEALCLGLKFFRV